MFYKILNFIKINYNHKNKYAYKKINPKDFSIIKILINVGVLKMVVKKNKNHYLFVFNYINKNKVFFNIKNMYKPSHKKFIKLNELKKLVINKKYFLILSTNKGVITSVDAVKNKIGGLIIAKIWN